ncbi:MAG TPA: pyridoxal phosphate-dependent aminotransferase [Acetobacteraceae bacterium]|jgi:aspartate/methionine/tyrosine aminotransferase|nr:pyridoxal phosphate-dependent aminotransferase [Acetobacteraceae bacterium]
MIRSSIDEMPDSPIVEVWRLGFGRPDVIGMFAGEADVPTPAFICDAAAESLAAGNTFYTPNRGLAPTRAAIASYHRRVHGIEIADGRIALTPSGMSAVMLVAQGIIEPGDTAVVVTPGWPNVSRAMEICGARVVEVAMRPTDAGWVLDLEALFDACDEKTRVIYLASPGNPTGWIMEEDQARAILDFGRARDIAVLSDEVYHRLVYDRPVSLSMLQIAGPHDNLYVVNSFSKSYAMTGWRLGWIVFPQGQTDAFEKLIQFNSSGAPAFLQHGAIAALDHGEEFIASFVARCRAGQDVVAQRLARMQRIRAVPSKGGFYAMFEVAGMRDTLGFCRRAVDEARIGMAPGIAFGAGAERHIRLCTAKAPELLDVAMDRLEDYVAHYQDL